MENVGEMNYLRHQIATFYCLVKDTHRKHALRKRIQ